MRVSYLYEAKLRPTNSAIECQESQAWDLKNMNGRDPEHRVLPEKTKVHSIVTLATRSRETATVFLYCEQIRSALNLP
jgi:hypothetical protein